MAAKTASAEKKSVERYMVPVVRSTFRILEELSRSGALGLNDIAVRTKVSKSTVFRIMTTLTQLGYVVCDPERKYFVSPALGDLVSEGATLEALRRAALPYMLKLRDQFGETVNLGHLQLDKVVYIEVVPSEYALRLHERAGAAVSVHASALGKAILAFSPPELAETLIRGRQHEVFTRNTLTDPDDIMADLRRVREWGYAFDKGEASSLANCVGAPILDAHGKAIGAMSISGPASRFVPRHDSPVSEALLRAVAEISRRFQVPAEGESADTPKRKRQRGA